MSKRAHCARHRTPSAPRTCLAVLQLALFGAGGIRATDCSFQSFFDQELDVLFQALEKKNREVSVNISTSSRLKKQHAENSTRQGTVPLPFCPLTVGATVTPKPEVVFTQRMFMEWLRDGVLVHRTVRGSGLCTQPRQGQGQRASQPGDRRRGAWAPHRPGARWTPGPVHAPCPPQNLLTGPARPLHLPDVSTEPSKKGQAG